MFPSLLKILQQRSTVRNWKDKPVKKRHIEYITKCISLTPYNQYKYDCKITIVTNREILQEVFHKHSTCYENEDGIMDIGQPMPSDYNRTKLLFQGQLIAPVVVFASMPAENHEAENHGYMTIFNAALAALECGLDTGFSACINSTGDINNLIGLPKNYETFLGLGIGYGLKKNKIDYELSEFDRYHVNVFDEQGNIIGYNKKNMLPGMSRDQQVNYTDVEKKIIRIID